MNPGDLGAVLIFATSPKQNGGKKNLVLFLIRLHRGMALVSHTSFWLLS